MHFLLKVELIKKYLVDFAKYMFTVVSFVVSFKISGIAISLVH